MAVPNRLQEIKAIVARYSQAFGPPDDTIDARRRLLIPIIVRELNKLDGDKWFLLNRLDRHDDEIDAALDDLDAWRGLRGLSGSN